MTGGCLWTTGLLLLAVYVKVSPQVNTAVHSVIKHVRGRRVMDAFVKLRHHERAVIVAVYLYF